MIGEPGDDHPLPAGHTPGDAQRQVIRLGAGAGKHHVPQRVGHGGQKAFCIGDDTVMQIAGVGVQNRGLPGNGLYNVRVAMAHGCDVVIGIEIPASLLVPEPDTFPFDDVKRLFVEQAIGRTKHLFAPGDQGAVLGGEAIGAGWVEGIDHGHVICSGCREARTAGLPVRSSAVSPRRDAAALRRM